MNVLENLRLAFQSIMANRLRSGLTILGIVIGVMAVITMLSIGGGTQASVTRQIESIGTNLLIILPGRLTTGTIRGGLGSAITLTYADSEALKDLPSVNGVAPVVQTAAQVVYLDSNFQTNLIGTTPDYTEVRNHRVASGSFFTESHIKARSLVAVLGADVAKSLFGEQDPVGQLIKINRISFRVIGVLEKKGGAGMFTQDDLVIIPITTAFTYFPRRADWRGQPSVTAIYVQARDRNLLNQTIEEVRAILRSRHNLTPSADDDFSIITQEDMLGMANAITNIFTIFLGSIGAISLIVGGIGIMNIMLVSVTERTREIGIRMAVGAKRRDILLQFLTEATVLSLLGGAIGIILGWLASWGVSKINIGGSNIETLVTPWSILLAVVFSAAVGLFFGIYPANKAAHLNPIEALRYE